MTIQNDGVHGNVGAQSEQIPVVPGTSYFITTTCSYSLAWASGAGLLIAYYTASGSQISSVSANQTNMSANTNYTFATSPAAAPPNASYMVAYVTQTGLPTSSNVLSVYQAEVADTNGHSVNINYTFTNTFQPWTNLGIGVVLGWQFQKQLPGDKDSLVIAEDIELMGGGVRSTIPELLDSNGVGPFFRLIAPPNTNSMAFGYENSYDLSAPQPTQDVVESMLLDGERPFGTRASNRTPSLPVLIFGTQAGGMTQVNAALEYLMALIDQQSWQLKWTPESTGLPMLLDCFRALPTNVSYGFVHSAGDMDQSKGGTNFPAASLTISLQALPYGRSDLDGVQSIQFTNPLVNGNSIASAVTLDAYSSLGTGGNWSLDPVQGLLSAKSAHYQAPRPMHMPWPAAVYTKTLAPVDITGLTSLAVWFGQSYDTQWPKDTRFVSNVTLAWTLTDSSGHTLTFSTAVKKCPWGENPAAPKWTRITANIPQGKRPFSYNSVASYSVRVTNWAGSGTTGYVRMHCWLNGLTANPSSIANATTPRGLVYNLFGIKGTARAPISVQCQLPSSNNLQSQELTSSGTWTVPAGVYSVKAEAWGGGGAGASVNSNQAGAGGGGAEYAAEPSLPVTPGTAIPVNIGAAGVPAQLAPTVVQFKSTQLGHWTCPPNVTSVKVECWGAGAAGGAGAGGAGGGGYSANPSVSVTPGTTYYMWVGKGGIPDTGKTTADNAARNGQGTWFGPNGTKYGSTSYVFALGGLSPLTGSTNGAWGGNSSLTAGAIGVTRYYGGKGGASPGNAGGGGGGAAGSGGNGSPGGDSPRVSNRGTYAQGGAGGAGSGQGGSGGAGANQPGYPSPGIQPGGGGGGGYSLGQNYLGAKGGDGMVQLTYFTNNGAAVSGGQTTFGSTATTGQQLVANGGASAAANASTGASGGAGSSNTTHFNGGKGANSGGTNYVSLAFPSTCGSTSYTTGTGTITSSTAIPSGASIVFVSSAAAVSDLTVSDSAGNAYTAVNQKSAPGGATVYSFVSNVTFPITTSTVLTVTSATAQQYAVGWYGTTTAFGVIPGNVNSNSGSSTAPSVTLGNGDSATAAMQLVVFMNSGSQAITAPASPPWKSAGSLITGGSLAMAAYSSLDIGSTTTPDTATGAYGSSANWASLAVPLTLRNQANAIFKTGTSAASGTSIPVTTATPVQAQGVLVATVSGAASSTITASGSGLTWTQRGTVSIGSAQLHVFAAPVTSAIAAGATAVTFTDATSQAHAAALYWVPAASAVDAGTFTSATGSSTAPSVTMNAPATPGDFLFGVIGNNATASLSANSWNNPWLAIDNPVTGTQDYQVFAASNTGLTQQVLSGSYSSSQSWGALSLGLTLNANNSSVGGSGGGASAGPNGAGWDAADNAGGSGYTGGGKGGDGAYAVNSAGNSAALPGGGGGGGFANSTATIAPGGSGGSGLVRLSWLPPLTTFNNLIVHHPSDGAPQTLNPVSPIPVSDTPSNIEYNVASTLPYANAKFNGTYTVLLANYSWDNPGASRQITVTITQYEYLNGPSYSVQATRSVTPSTDVVNGIVTMGEITLPVKDSDQSNDQSYFTFSVHDTDNADRFQDILFLDTLGQTAIVNIPPGTNGYGKYINYYIDEPSIDRDLGKILGTTGDRKASVSVLDSALISGGPLYVTSGDNLLLTYSISGAPNLQVTYAPRWYVSRTV
jgi:hypothetical protein